MKAIVYTEFGPPEVLRLQEVEKPTPKNDEVIVKLFATTVTSGDYRMRSSPASLRIIASLTGNGFGVKTPSSPILGSEFAGEIESVGEKVTLFKVGDQVYGDSGSLAGAYAEYLSMPADGAIAAKPTNLTFEEAAAIPRGAQTALYFVRDKGKIKSGQDVLVYGASGSVGTYAVQLANYYGANVTGVCSTANLDLVQSLGVQRVIDYTEEDFTKADQSYDVIYETVGKSSISDGKNVLRENGVYLAGSGGVSGMVQMLWTTVVGNKKVIFGIAPERKEDLYFITALVEDGKLKPVIDRTYPLEHTAEAHRYADRGHKKGNVVITMKNGN
jgi:NADPH:quinone reductase-like Zn-dependent oxidoreductase